MSREANCQKNSQKIWLSPKMPGFQTQVRKKILFQTGNSQQKLSKQQQLFPKEGRNELEADLAGVSIFCKAMPISRGPY